VHGNDESADATRELPYQQLLTVAGQRLLLCHSHLPDREQEMASRNGDDWSRPLRRYASQAQRSDARIYVLGHWHIPFVWQGDNVWLINPGAIASGSPLVRQRVQTVAFLFVRDDGRPFVRHVDLAHPTQPYPAQVQWADGIRAAYVRYHESILSPELEALLPQIRKLGVAHNPALRDAYLRLAHRCWAGEIARVTLSALVAEITNDAAITLTDKEQVLTTLLQKE
jgi:hypothetical protein